MHLTVVFVGLAAQLFLGLSMASGPYTPGGKGNTVVTQVVNMINSLGVSQVHLPCGLGRVKVRRGPRYLQARLLRGDLAGNDLMSEVMIMFH